MQADTKFSKIMSTTSSYSPLTSADGNRLLEIELASDQNDPIYIKLREISLLPHISLFSLCRTFAKLGGLVHSPHPPIPMRNPSNYYHKLEVYSLEV